MNFRILNQDGPGHIGEIKIKNKKINSPNILFIDSKRFKSPSFSEIVLTKTDKDFEKSSIKFLENIDTDKDFFQIKENNFHKIDETNIYFLKYSKQLFRKTNDFLSEIIKIREKKGYGKILYMPAISEPSNLSLLVYLGIDLFDSTNAIIKARKKIMFFSDGNKKAKDLKENPCTCPICMKLKKEPKEMTFKEILNHNYYMLFSEIKNIRNSIRNNNLRDLVEKRVKTSPHLTSILRKLDENYNDFLEEKAPLIESNILNATSIESLNRPEIKRFQKRVIDRYKKPKKAKILLLLPCSAKKPYSFSKSHSFFRRATQSTNNPEIIHEIIITSPMGLVPRELELIYPASNYDIPVTGKWFECEKKLINSLLKKYLKKNKYDFVISHLKDDMNEFIEKVVKIDKKTCKNHPTSDESLNELKNSLKNITKDYEKVRRNDRIKENIESFASYQFGKKIAKKMLDSSKIIGRYPYQKIIKKNKQIGMIVKEKGSISLTLDGAEILFQEKTNIVEISSDFELKGSVFAPGIKNASENIRIGDEVIVVSKNNLLGVGSALMNGFDMKNLSFGEAVKIRHLKKN